MLLILISCNPSKSVDKTPTSQKKIVDPSKLMPIAVSFADYVPDSIRTFISFFLADLKLQLVNHDKMLELSKPSMQLHLDAVRNSTKQSIEERMKDGERAMYTVGTYLSIDFKFADSINHKFLLNWRSIPAPMRATEMLKIPSQMIDTTLLSAITWPGSLKKAVELIVQSGTLE